MWYDGKSLGALPSAIRFITRYGVPSGLSPDGSIHLPVGTGRSVALAGRSITTYCLRVVVGEQRDRGRPSQYQIRGRPEPSPTVNRYVSVENPAFGTVHLDDGGVVVSQPLADDRGQRPASAPSSGHVRSSTHQPM